MSQENTESVGGKKSPTFDTLKAITAIAIGATFIVLIGVLEYRRQVANLPPIGRLTGAKSNLPGWTPPKDGRDGPWNPPTSDAETPEGEDSR